MRDAGCLTYVTGKSSLIGLVKTNIFTAKPGGGRNIKILKELRRRCGGKFEVKAFLKTTTQ